MKHKINNAKENTYIFKLENEINKLKSTLELQSSLRHYNRKPEAASFNINSSQQFLTSNYLNSNHQCNDIVEQRLKS